MFSCCLWWFILGALVGWLLNWLLCRCTNCRSGKCSDNTSNSLTTPVKPENTPEPAIAHNELSSPATPRVYVLDTAAAKAAGFKPAGPNDLTVVEGIGPKINELFNHAGITTFAQLAKQTVPQMQKVLDEAGPRYKLAKPNTWAQQAALAAENKWSELKTLQDKLSGGV